MITGDQIKRYPCINANLRSFCRIAAMHMAIIAFADAGMYQHIQDLFTRGICINRGIMQKNNRFQLQAARLLNRGF